VAAVPHAAADLAVLAEAVARAHDAGHVHGPFLPEHVRSGPLLLGWSALPPAGWTQADDVRSFGELLALSGHDALAARAAGDPAGRPGMRSLAAALRPAPTVLRPARRHPPPTRWRRIAVLAPAAAAVLLAATMVVRAPGSAASRLPPVEPSTSTTTTLRATGAGDGTVVHDGHRWAAGIAGDAVVLGDWDGDGIRTPAVLRPTTGQVWRYDDWPVNGAPGAARALGIVPGGARLAVRHGPGRDQLVVVGVGGQSTDVG
jgi:hypothetical protein